MARRKPQWANRMEPDTGVELVDPSTLLAHPLNYKVHTKLQKQAIEGSLAEVGWIDSIRVNRRTGLMLNGHARVTVAIEQKEPVVPVTYVDLPEELEAKALAYFDTVGTEFFEVDETKWQEILAQISTDNTALQGMLDALSMEQESVRLTSPLVFQDGDDSPGTPDRSHIFDASKLDGAGAGGQTQEAYRLYITFQDEQSWRCFIQMFAPYDEKRIQAKHRILALEGHKLLEYNAERVAHERTE